MGDQAQQEERVLQWLKKRGYTEVAKHYEEEQQQPGEGEGAAGEGHLKRRVGEANQNALLFRSVHLSDPSIYHRSYNELQTWICNALEAYKPELLTVSFPVFVHCYLKLVERGEEGGAAAAKAFLQTWGPDHEAHYPLELRSLKSVQGPQQLHASDFCRRTLAEKFVVRLCATSYRLLMAFLSDHHLLPLMEILNERVKVLIEERPPRGRFEVVTFDRDGVAGQAAGATGRAFVLMQPHVRWRVNAPPTGEDPGNTTVPEATHFNGHLVRKLHFSAPPRFLEGGSGEAAHYPHVAPAAGAGATTPVYADATSPTVLMASVANTYGGLMAARFTQDATQLATGYGDRAVRVFRLLEAAGGVGGAGVEEGQPLVLRGHSGAVHALAWSPEQQFLFSGGADGQVRLWDVGAGGRNVVVYRTPTGFPIWALATAPLGRFFLTGSYDRVARIWCTARTQPVRMLAGHYSDVSCVCWHPNCNYVVTGSWDKTARLWDVQTGRCLRIYAGHFGPMTALAISHDGRFVAGAGGGASASFSSSKGGGGGGGGGGGDHGVIRIWDISSGSEVAALSGHRGPVYGLSFSRTSTVLASAGADETVRTWDLNGDLASVTCSIAIAPHTTLRTKGTPVFDVQWTKRDLLLACGGV